jgi:hypothetical protein
MMSYICISCDNGPLALPNQFCPPCQEKQDTRKEQEQLASQDPRVQAIRQHPRLNASSCTTISECFTDAELLDHIVSGARPGRQLTPDQAVLWALDYEGLQIEAALNCRWGEDSDQELTAYQRWQADCEAAEHATKINGHSQSHPDQQV